MVRPRVALGALLSTLLIAQSALAGINFVGAELTSVPPQSDYMATGDMNNDGLVDLGGQEHLDGAGHLEHLVDAHVDGAHATLSELARELVRADRSPGQVCHRTVGVLAAPCAGCVAVMSRSSPSGSFVV